MAFLHFFFCTNCFLIIFQKVTLTLKNHPMCQKMARLMKKFQLLIPKFNFRQVPEIITKICHKKESLLCNAPNYLFVGSVIQKGKIIFRLTQWLRLQLMYYMMRMMLELWFYPTLTPYQYSFFQVEKKHTQRHRVFNVKLNEISYGSQVRNIINDELPLFIFLRNFLLCIYANSKTGFFLLLLFLQNFRLGFFFIK